MSKKKRNKKFYFYNCTITDERFKTTEQASNPDELLSVNAYYEMNAELDDRPEHIKLEMEKRVEAKPASEPTE